MTVEGKASRRKPGRPSSGERDSADTKLVLVIENDEWLSNLIDFILRAVGYAVEVTAGEHDGTTKAPGAVPDLIVVDQALDVPRALCTLSQTGRCDSSSFPPIIMLADRLTRSVVSAAASEGVVDFLEKPLRLPFLVESVRFWLPQEAERRRTGCRFRMPWATR